MYIYMHPYSKIAISYCTNLVILKVLFYSHARHSLFLSDERGLQR
jgi:hypothetical protein